VGEVIAPVIGAIVGAVIGAFIGWLNIVGTNCLTLSLGAATKSYYDWAGLSKMVPATFPAGLQQLRSLPGWCYYAVECAFLSTVDLLTPFGARDAVEALGRVAQVRGDAREQHIGGPRRGRDPLPQFVGLPPRLLAHDRVARRQAHRDRGRLGQRVAEQPEDRGEATRGGGRGHVRSGGRARRDRVDAARDIRTGSNSRGCMLRLPGSKSSRVGSVGVWPS
jgi:hypothetical protein